MELQTTFSNNNTKSVDEVLSYLKTQLIELQKDTNMDKVSQLLNVLQENVSTLQRIETLLELVYQNTIKEEEIKS